MYLWYVIINYCVTLPSIWVLLHAHIVISGTGAFLVIYEH